MKQLSFDGLVWLLTAGLYVRVLPEEPNLRLWLYANNGGKTPIPKKLSTYLDASISANTPLPLPSVGSFVGMIFHNAAQALD
jgi:hypothetical protein